MSDEQQQTTPDGTQPLGNDQTARNPDGSIKDQQAQPPSGTPSPETPPQDSKVQTPEEKAAADAAKTAGAPEKYTDFTLPENFALAPEVLTEATTMFREMNLSQDAAQKLVDFHTKQLAATAEAPVEAYNALREEWRGKVKADTTIGSAEGLRPEVKAAIGRMWDSVGDAALVAEVKSAMDLTGIGDHPAFISTMYKLAQKIGEGTPTTTGKPVPPPNSAPSPAAAMYPNLPSQTSGR